MNDHDLENTLRKAPQPAAPPGLKQKLENDLTLARNPGSRPAERAVLPFCRRWFPAMACGVLLLSAFLVLALQANEMLALRRENAGLRQVANQLETLREQNAELDKMRLQARQLERLRKDSLEVQPLRAEVEKLRAQLQELPRLRAEHQRLLAQRAAQAASGPVEDDPFAEARDKAQSITCVSNLKQIGLAARLWSNDHNDVLPTDFLTMKNELNTPKILVCPSDAARYESRAADWAQFNPQNVTYQILSPGIPETDPQVVYAICPIHGSVNFVDGSVQNGILKKGGQIVERDGKKYVQK